MGKEYVRNARTDAGVRAKSFSLVHTDAASFETMVNKHINAALTGQQLVAQPEEVKESALPVMAAPSSVDLDVFNESCMVFTYDQFGEGHGAYAAFDLTGNLNLNELVKPVTQNQETKTSDPLDIILLKAKLKLRWLAPFLME